jgi:RNA polymerase sigma factor (sigma-70 family)
MEADALPNMVDADQLAEDQTDAVLLEAVRAGDVGAYGLLFRRHAEPARRLAARYLTSPAEQHELAAEAFARVLAALRGGAGPHENLRPYLLVTMRHLAIQWRRREDRVQLYGAVPETGCPLDGATTESDEIVLRRWNMDLVRSAFQSLPPRWRMVLWRTEVERAPLGDLASVLAISPNGVAALAMRAREGLRQAYLQVQVPTSDELACQAARHQMGMWVRGGLSRLRSRPIVAHLGDCPDCQTVVALLTEANRELRATVPDPVPR